MRNRTYPFLVLCFTLMFFTIASISAQHQHETNLTTSTEAVERSNDFVILFGILELPFLFFCIYYSFMTARALRGGIFGKGMNFLAWGFLVMAVGHIAMQITHIWGIDIFRDFMGEIIGSITWFVALIVTWSLSASGFYQIYRVSKQV